MSKRLLGRIQTVYKKCRLGIKNTAKIVIESWDWQVSDEGVELVLDNNFRLIEASVLLASMLAMASCEMLA